MDSLPPIKTDTVRSPVTSDGPHGPRKQFNQNKKNLSFIYSRRLIQAEAGFFHVYMKNVI